MTLNDQYDMTETQLVPGFLRGYRSWRVARDPMTKSYLLQSYNWDHIFWNKGINVARCVGNSERKHGDPAPLKGCTCGFYATYDFDFPVASYDTTGHGTICGSMKATGRVILGTKGMKAERVQVEALYGGGRLVGPAVALKYQVPWFPDGESFEEAYPAPDVEALIGPLPPVHVRWAQNLGTGDWAPSDEDALLLYQWSAQSGHKITFHHDWTQTIQQYPSREVWGHTYRGDAGLWVKVSRSMKEGQPATVEWNVIPPWGTQVTI